MTNIVLVSNFYINQDGLLGKKVYDSRTILDKEESLKIWEHLYQNPSKLTIEPLTQYDIFQKDYKHKKIKQVATTILGSKSVVLLEIIDFKEDKSKTHESFGFFFIKIKRNHQPTI